MCIRAKPSDWARPPRAHGRAVGGGVFASTRLHRDCPCVVDRGGATRGLYVGRYALGARAATGGGSIIGGVTGAALMGAMYVVLKGVCAPGTDDPCTGWLL